jgi:uncharacterized delta-60 repeat protein
LNDYATVKYSPDGNELWVARYNGPGNGSDSTRDLTVDNSGNIYVTGSSSTDYATVKYSPDGNQLWVARYNGEGNSTDQAYALAVDNSGNVYVGGYSSCSGGMDFNYATVKYSPDGNQLWVADYSGTVDNPDTIQALAVDNSGNIYVTGYSWDTAYDYATVKYSPDGNQLWVKRYNGPQGNGSDFTEALALDSSGNVYVTGWSSGGGTSYDYATIKYTQHGICLGPVVGDLYNDCKVDFKDFAIFSSHWLECNYVLEEDCQ